MLKHIHHSLRIKLILASIIIEIVMLSLLLANSLRLSNDIIEEQTVLRIEAINPLLEASLSVGLFQRDYEIVDHIIHQLKGVDEQGFEYLIVIDDRGRIYAQTDNFNQNNLPIPDVDVKNALERHVFNGMATLSVSGQKVGEVRYGLSIASFIEGKEKILHQSFLIANIEVILTALLLGLTGYFLTRHLGMLMKGTESIRDGNYDIDVKVNSQDEIGLLANEFNLMAQAVRSRVRELNDSKNALMKSQAQFESIFHSIADVVIFVDTDYQCIMVNPMVIRMFGYSPEEVIGKNIEFIYQKRQDYEHYLRMTKGFEHVFSDELSLVRKNDHLFTGEVLTSAVKDKQNHLIGYVSIIRDITERKEIQDALNKEKEQAQVTLESIGDAVITTDAKGFVDYLNPIAEAMVGWNRNDATGRLLPEVFRVYNEITGQPIENPVQRCLKENRIIEISKYSKLIGRHGDEYSIEDSAAPIRNKQDEVIGVVLVFHDVSTSRKMALELSWQATHDALTGLINRQEFEVRLEKMLHSAHEEGKTHSLLYLDLDQFKVVNDTSGHIAGDQLLRQLSDRFQQLIRDTDTLARLGGDEFGILMNNCPLEQAIRVADSFLKLLEDFRFIWDDKPFTLGVSIGVVSIDSDLESISQLLSYADIACYAAKESGRNRIHVYQADDNELVKRQGEMRWLAQIKLALEKDDFVLYAQPIEPVRGNGSQELHFEILLRLQDVEGNIIPPIAFLPAAERYDLMTHIDRWVVNKAFACLLDKNMDNCLLSINLSGQSLGDESFLDFIINELRSLNIPSHSICFEITETAAISNYSNALKFITRLRKEGCYFSLDDFGSGLSSFGYLKNFPVDFLKIDGSFVKDMIDDPIDYAMVVAINQIGHVMNIKTIAEFVENHDILKKLETIGVDYAQGYGIARPMPLEQAINRVLSQTKP